MGCCQDRRNECDQLLRQPNLPDIRVRVEIKTEATVLRHEPAVPVFCRVIYGGPGVRSSTRGWRKSEPSDYHTALSGCLSTGHCQYDSRFRRKGAITRFVEKKNHCLLRIAL